jgi:hypothetical protein
MILRRATDLSTGDNVRLEDGLLWNVAEVVWVDGRCSVHLSRTVGDKMVLEQLWPDDLILLAT